MEFWTRKFRVVMGTGLGFSFFLSFFQTLAQACDVRWGVVYFCLRWEDEVPRCWDEVTQEGE